MIYWEDLTQVGKEEVIRLVYKESEIPDNINLNQHFEKWIK